MVAVFFRHQHGAGRSLGEPRGAFRGGILSGLAVKSHISRGEKRSSLSYKAPALTEGPSDFPHAISSQAAAALPGRPHAPASTQRVVEVKRRQRGSEGPPPPSRQSPAPRAKRRCFQSRENLPPPPLVQRVFLHLSALLFLLPGAVTNNSQLSPLPPTVLSLLPLPLMRLTESTR